MLDQALMARPREIAEQVAELARQILGPNIEVLWFGSWVKGTAQPHADIDIAVTASEPIPLQEMAALRDAIDHLPTLHEIDLIDLLTVGQTFREEILGHGIRQ